MQPLTEGFTLIELLITIMIIVIISAISIAGYKAFNTRQTLVQEGRNVRTFLRQAQIDAQTSTQPSTGCNSVVNRSMSGLRVTVSNTQMSINVQCVDTNGGQTSLPSTRTYNRASTKISFSPISVIDFFILSQGSSGGKVCIETSDLSSQFYRITITQAGEIHDDGIQSGC